MTHGTSTPQAQHSPAAQPWPEGVTRRYLTKAAELTGNHTLAVEVSEQAGEAHSRCTGCGHPERTYYAPEIKYRAQKHAETCRALPRPA
ncbi:hypothetical protein ACGFNY_04995 [Streptomyces chartreusis]|uniref:hypothetical protein n=1 Tax=Streptomyces chartreusis TaxID=1969 RepID=UPI003720EAA9